MPEPSYTGLIPLTQKSTPNQSARSGVPVRLVVVHEPVGGYEGTVNFIMKPSAQVSYHVLTDEPVLRATQFVGWNRKSWSAKAFNSNSDHISIAGVPGRWSFPALNRLARIVAFRLKERNLPATFVKAPVGSSARGFTYHSQLGAAGGNHSDPRFNAAQSAFFIAAVKWHRKVGRFRASWGRD